jgi:hypothetical protein
MSTLCVPTIDSLRADRIAPFWELATVLLVTPVRRCVSIWQLATVLLATPVRR